MAGTMKTTVTPVLSSVAGYISDVRLQVAQLVQFMIMNPGGISSLWNDQLVSFQHLAAKYEKNRRQLASALATQVKMVLEKRFDQYQFECNFTTSDYIEGVEDGRYRIKIEIMMTTVGSDNAPVSALISGTLKVDPATNSVLLNYDLNTDTVQLTTN